MKYPWAVPGRKVLCLYGDWTILPEERAPQEGQTYTIREILPHQESVYLCFEEITNPFIHNAIDGPGEARFEIRAFKPLTDISSLQKILTSVPVKEDA